jgi:hypothetical protein
MEAATNIHSDAAVEIRIVDARLVPLNVLFHTE